MIYSNDSLRIVPFERSRHMTDEYRSWFHDSAVTRYNSHGLFPYTPSQMDEFVKTIEQGNGSKIVWAIEVAMSEAEKKQGKGNYMPPTPKHFEQMSYGWKHIGNCSLQGINWINRSAEFAIVLGRGRGKGSGRQACAWVLEHAFLKIGLNRVWTGTAASNVGMNAVCMQLGMKLEAQWEDGMWLNGEFVTVHGYGITRKRWNELR